MKHYQDIMDEIYGLNYKHRTLRTLFDPNSSEWNETSITEKLDILKTILNSKLINLEDLILSYRIFYSVEINKSHVIKSMEKALSILLSNAI